jgi:protein-S-isoprenylcysteine O-methyltransferase Ste14
MAVFVVAALEDGRFHWLPVPNWVCWMGYAMLAFGMFISAWAGSVNKFAEPTVRIQTDRGHKVIDTGPYAIVGLFKMQCVGDTISENLLLSKTNRLSEP